MLFKWICNVILAQILHVVKIELIQVGKTTDSYLREGVLMYENRVKKYVSFDVKTLPELRNAASVSTDQQKVAEGKTILDQIEASDYVVLLDERGEEFTSVGFADFIQKRMLTSLKKLIFVIGGPYGFSPACYERANLRIALSKMTFSHQMVRLVFNEQLYRAMTILKNEQYHH
jgi:23S rRNA (pseudouridine1915-N3)-methyltransferase